MEVKGQAKKQQDKNPPSDQSIHLISVQPIQILQVDVFLNHVCLHLCVYVYVAGYTQ